MIITRKQLALSTALLFSLFLAGCSMTTSTSVPAAVKGSAIKGRVMGGQQPVAFGSVQLWAAGTSGYGSASTPLISTSLNTVGSTTPVNTDSTGNFTITGDFTCPTVATTPVYLTITGGNPGNGGGVINNNLALMAALGPCNNLVHIPFVNVSEISTVASVWALAPFMTAIDHIGTTPTNSIGLVNAFAAVNKVVNIGTGAIGGPALPAGATLPVDEINGLADILSVCVNSTGGVASDTSTNCGALFNAAKPGTTAPTDTVTAAMNIAQNPSLNAGTLWGLIPSTGAVFPTSVAQPAAWTIAINYTGGGLSTPKGIATDAHGNVWLPNSGNNSVTELDNTGAAQSGANGFTATSLGLAAGSLNLPSSIAVDASGNAWITNAGNNTLTSINSTSGTGASFNGNGLSIPQSIAFDSSGNIWVANNGGNSVSAFTSTGGTIGTYTGGGISTPIGLAVNPQ
jgi:hypothetical protein